MLIITPRFSRFICIYPTDFPSTVYSRNSSYLVFCVHFRSVGPTGEPLITNNVRSNGQRLCFQLNIESVIVSVSHDSRLKLNVCSTRTKQLLWNICNLSQFFIRVINTNKCLLASNAWNSNLITSTTIYSYGILCTTWRINRVRACYYIVLH